jgi:putative effector of murein hydrolase LrgA (UPF0299 family)
MKNDREVKYDIALIIIGTIAGLLLNVSTTAAYSLSIAWLNSFGLNKFISEFILFIVPLSLAVFLFKDLLKSINKKN